jgi:hypothetical protein
VIIIKGKCWFNDSLVIILSFIVEVVSVHTSQKSKLRMSLIILVE